MCDPTVTHRPSPSRIGCCRLDVHRMPPPVPPKRKRQSVIYYRVVQLYRPGLPIQSQSQAVMWRRDVVHHNTQVTMERGACASRERLAVDRRLCRAWTTAGAHPRVPTPSIDGHALLCCQHLPAPPSPCHKQMGFPITSSSAAPAIRPCGCSRLRSPCSSTPRRCHAPRDRA